jgi:hypothetical protein
MDLAQSRRYFDAQVFDAYNFVGSSWNLAAFKGKLDLANPKVSLMNKGTRQRMLYVSPGQEPTSSVIRHAPTAQIFLVGTQSKDDYKGAYLRDVIALHLVQNTAVLHRRAPVGPSNDPGFAVDAVIENTFADYEFRSDNEDQQNQINQWGSFNLFLPSSSSVREHDTLVIEGRTFYIFDVYNDSGTRGAHATDRPDDRVNFVYTVLTNTSYDPAQLKPVQTTTPYNVTGEITPYTQQQDSNEVINKTKIKVMIKVAWIGVVPKLNDLVTYLGQDYRVTKIAQNKLQDEWHLVAEV